MTKKYVLKSEPTATNFAIDYAKELNPSQLEVVTQPDGPSLVLAGAGSGKTRTLIYRVAFLLEKGVRPEEILLVTFTNKASQEMRGRVELLLKTQARGLWSGTFHHIGNRLLRMYGKHIQLKDDFGILDDEDSRDLVKTCMKSLNLASAKGGFPKPGVVQSVISFTTNAQMPLAQVIAQRYAYLTLFTREFEKIKSLYEERKRRTNNLDFDDLLAGWLSLLTQSDVVREKLTRQFRYCLVDEYQDTNRLQHEIIKRMSSHHKNTLVVGDDAQSIYSFRAADVKNILDFPGDFERARIYKLETNYRSTKAILDLANQSIKNNVHQFPKALQSVHGSGITPQFVKVRDARQEACFIAQRITDMQKEGRNLSQIAVLFRAHFHAAELEMELAKRNIPYIIRGGIRFFEQAHIKDVLAYLKIVSNSLDEISWTRVLTLQKGIGGGYADKIFSLIEKEEGDLNKIAGPSFGQSLPSSVQNGLTSFKRTLKALIREDVQDRPDLMLEEILDKDYNKHVLMNFENAQDRLEDLRELVNFAHTYKKLKDFLSDVTLREGFKGETVVEAGAGQADSDELILSTIHQAKGLEWTAVFVMKLSDGQFPHAKAKNNEDDLEEERRLFYVASTRAKEELIMVHPMTRYDYKLGTIISHPSVFIQELPNRVYDDVEVEEDTEEETIYLD